MLIAIHSRYKNKKLRDYFSCYIPGHGLYWELAFSNLKVGYLIKNPIKVQVPTFFEKNNNENNEAQTEVKYKISTYPCYFSNFPTIITPSHKTKVNSKSQTIFSKENLKLFTLKDLCIHLPSD
jgi:hypothetical protein